MEGTNYLEIANSLAMWSAAGLAVAVVLVQALIFSKKSYSTGLEMGLPAQMKEPSKAASSPRSAPSALDISSLWTRIQSPAFPAA